MAVRTRGSGLNAETRRLLGRLRRERPANKAYGKPVEVVKDEAHRLVDRLVAASGLDRAMTNEVGWFVTGVAEALTYGRDEGLAFALEALVAKWVGLGLERNTAELVLRMVVREVGGVEEQAKSEVRRQSAEVRSEDAESSRPVIDIRHSSIGNALEVEDETGE
jgi:hypothetical protein